MIKKCKCPHKEQDKLHGEGKRVHNICDSPSGRQTACRCTVCESAKEKGQKGE